MGIRIAGISKKTSDASYKARQGTVTPESFGAVGDGVTNDTAAFQAALDVALSSVVIECDPTKKYRLDGQLTLTVSDSYRRLTSAGGARSELFRKDTDYPDKGGYLDLRYAGSDAKIIGMVPGTLEIDHLAVIDKGTSSNPFIFVNRTAPKIHDNVFAGNPTKSSNLCDQDVLTLGGTGTTTAANTPTSAFQGYSAFIRENTFHRIRRAVTWQNYANSVPAIANTIDPTCGSNQTIDAPFVIDTGTANAVDGLHFASGNVIAFNLIEVAAGYAHGIILRNMASGNLIHGNSFWDMVSPPDGKYVSDVLCDQASGASGNKIYLNGESLFHTVTGISNGGNNWVFSKSQQIMPSGWVLRLKGDVTGNHTMAYDATPDGPQLTGYDGVGVKVMSPGGSGQQFSFRVINTANPNGSRNGNVGDLCISKVGGYGATLWVKESGAGTNTGWVAHAGVPTAPMPASGMFLHTSSPGATATSSTLGVGTLRLTPWMVQRPVSLSSMLVQVGTPGEAGAKFRIGLYGDTGSNMPGALVVDAGQVAADATAWAAAAVAVTLQPGLYWIGGAVQSVVTTQPQIFIPNQFYSPPMALTASTGTTPGTIQGSIMGFNQTGVTGALPATFASTGATANVPRITVQIA